LHEIVAVFSRDCVIQYLYYYLKLLFEKRQITNFEYKKSSIFIGAGDIFRTPDIHSAILVIEWPIVLLWKERGQECSFSEFLRNFTRMCPRIIRRNAQKCNTMRAPVYIIDKVKIFWHWRNERKGARARTRTHTHTHTHTQSECVIYYIYLILSLMRRRYL